MSLFRDALRDCGKEGEDFWGVVIETAHKGGHVYITPECVVIAQQDSPDTLFIWAFYGRGALARLCALAPAGTKWLKWWRGMRFDDPARAVQYPFERVKRLCAASSHHETPQDRPADCLSRSASGGRPVGELPRPDGSPAPGDAAGAEPAGVCVHGEGR